MMHASGGVASGLGMLIGVSIALGSLTQGGRTALPIWIDFMRLALRDVTENQMDVPEGIVSRVPFKGPVKNTVYQLVGGLRSGMGYLGAEDLDMLRERAEFVRVTASGLREAHPHDVTIIKEAPNYQIS